MADLLDDDEIYLQEHFDDEPTPEATAAEEEKKPEKKKKKKSTEIRRSRGNFSELINTFRVHYKKSKSEYELEEILSKFSSAVSVDPPADTSLPLDEFLHEVVPKKFWTKNVELGSAPVVIVVAQSALRCIELGKCLKNSSSKSTFTFAYLFAKHKKLSEEIEHFRRGQTRWNVVIGTPKRLDDLIQSGAMNLKRLKLIVIDWNYENVKKQRLTDLNQLKGELCSLLCERTSLLKRFAKEKTRLALF